ncbi:phosphoglucosamine mutase family protein [Anaeramoeba ignava]|uniref:Phosphoglucosamine mutase family protein n=1 Tax=Anaeramoeba ignava TaxID=1746090 RepID=A0A9Q0L9E3_ANAIG|nr:phosphoglucosamine mutase family protein [Anaeramoeba ignava]
MTSSYPLMASVSGIRGIFGKSFIPEVIEKYVASFINVQKETIKKENISIILGRDSRVSGSCVNNIVIGILLATGCDIIDIGIVPTPTVQVIVQQRKADGGIVITSSHNDVMWNGLKFIDNDGLFISPEKCKTLFKMVDEKKYSYNEYNKLGKYEEKPEEYKKHIEKILELEYIKPEEIKMKNLRICIDTINGAGGRILKELLEKLGCKEIIGINIEETGIFAHKPEPIPEHLNQLCEAVQNNKADLGIAVDPDADRCVLIDEKGQPLGEEYTLGFAVEFYLGKLGKKGNVCKNLSSSRVVDDIAAKYGSKVFNSAVGEINVAQEMIRTNSIIGGEGNGGVMLPDVHIGRDSLVSVALVLQLLSSFNGTISQLKNSLPQYQIAKLRIDLSPDLDPDLIIQQYVNRFSNTNGFVLNSLDGLRIDSKDWWVHLRKSNTEPIIRIIGESSDPNVSSFQLCQRFVDEIQDKDKK